MDSVGSQLPDRYLDLDVRQYLVYEEGDTLVDLPGGSFSDTPRDTEADALQGRKDVERKGDTLIFNLKSGKQKTLINNLSDDDSSTDYIFQKSIDAIGYWEVLAYYYESLDYVLINQNDGDEIHVWGRTILSPDNQYVLCSSVDLEAGFIANGFQLLKMDNGKLVEQWSKELTEWGAEKLIWTKDNYILGEQVYRDDTTGELKRRLIKMRMMWSEIEQ
jgi:hypothetical protein